MIYWSALLCGMWIKEAHDPPSNMLFVLTIGALHDRRLKIGRPHLNISSYLIRFLYQTCFEWSRMKALENKKTFTKLSNLCNLHTEKKVFYLHAQKIKKTWGEYPITACFFNTVESYKKWMNVSTTSGHFPSNGFGYPVIPIDGGSKHIRVTFGQTFALTA